MGGLPVTRRENVPQDQQTQKETHLVRDDEVRGNDNMSESPTTLLYCTLELVLDDEANKFSGDTQVV